jgi:hypothetical protein
VHPLSAQFGAQPAPPPPAPPEIHVAITASSWWDNDPPGQADNDHPVLHPTEDGQGTYADPITASLPKGADATYRPGSRFYLASLQRYVIAEDYGQPAPDSPSVATLLNIWTDGRDSTPAEAMACDDAVTEGGLAAAVVNPPPNLPVIAGPIDTHHACHIPPS